MTKGELLGCLRKLNKHYKRRVHFRTGYPRHGRNNPCADLYAQTLIFPPEPVFYDKHVLAHEYAHLLDNGVDSGHVPKLPEAAHDKEFELFYQEVCLVLGVFAIPTDEMASRALKLAVAREKGRQEMNEKGEFPWSTNEGPRRLWQASVESSLREAKSLQAFCKGRARYGQYEEVLEDLIRALEMDAVTAANM